MATTKAKTNNRASGKVQTHAASRRAGGAAVRFSRAQRDRSFGIVALACILALCTTFVWSAHTTLAYAKDITEKNEDQYNAVKMVATGEAPKKKDYSSTEDKVKYPSTQDNPSGGFEGAGGATDNTWKSGLTYDSDGYSKTELEYEDLDVTGNGADGSVFRGGNARSSRNNQPGPYFDNDPDDFASVLPYGTVYIDTDKLSFDKSNEKNFSIEINPKYADKFAWVAPPTYDGTEIKDRNETKPGFQVENYRGANHKNAIAYIGGINAYLSNSEAYKDWVNEDDSSKFKNYYYLNYGQGSTYTTKDGRTVTIGEGVSNIVEAAGGDYLYKFTFYDAATLPDGTPGKLVIKATRVEMEGSVDVPQGAPIGIQGANEICVNPVYYPVDSNGDELTQAPAYTYTDENKTQKTLPAPTLSDALAGAATVAGVKNGNKAKNIAAYIPSGEKVIVEASDGKKWNVMPAFGLKLSFDIEVLDASNHPVEGNISYSTIDLDVASRQALWGRTINTGDYDNDFKFNESLTIVSGSQSYAVVPNYDHANETSTAAGKLMAPKDTTDPLGGTVDQWLNITKTGNGQNADGVRFAASASHNWRAIDGTFNPTFNQGGAVSKANSFDNTAGRFIINPIPIWNLDGAVTSAMNSNNSLVGECLNYIKDTTGDEYTWYTAANAQKDFKDNTLTAGYYKSDGTLFTLRKLVDTAAKKQGVSFEEELENLMQGGYHANPGDGGTFDTGFAVLLSAEKTSMIWTGSNTADGSMGTTLFDSSMFTRVEQSHGTGGGIYLEGYTYDQQANKADIKANPKDYVKAVRSEGVVTMGKGVNTTVTAVPEDGYRVSSITIGEAKLANAEKYTLVYAPNGTVTHIKDPDDNAHQLGGDNKVTINGITFQVNQGSDVSKTGYGTVDITFENIQEPRHVHVDFTTDYYFYKVWKNPDGSSPQVIPDELKLRATPFTYEMKSVKIGNDTYEISEEGTKYKNTTTDEVYSLSTNYALTLPDGNGSYVIYELSGDTLVNSHNKNDKHKITTEIKSDTYKDFTIKDSTKDGNSNYRGYVNVLPGSDSLAKALGTDITDSDTVWLVKYPAEGVPSLNWDPLPIETFKESEHSNLPNRDNQTHVQRYYWFVTETAPDGWSMVDYDNDRALAPGVVTAKDIIKNEVVPTSDQENSFWVEQSGVYHAATEQLIESQEANDHAFMSPLSSVVTKVVDGTTVFTHKDEKDNLLKTWGGRITNFPSTIIEAKKVWENDTNNEFKTRQDVLFHLDATMSDGKKIEDYLPPILISRNETTDDKLKGSWGNKQTYTTDTSNPKYSNVVILRNADEIQYKESDNITDISYEPLPASDGRPGFVATSTSTAADSHNGKIYFINELSSYDAKGNPIKYSIRETSTVMKADGSGYESLIGYELQKAKDIAGNEYDFGAPEVLKDDIIYMKDGVEVPAGTPGAVQIATKSAWAYNKLEVVDFTVTKIWDENGATGDKRTHASDADKTRDANTLKQYYTMKEGGDETTIATKLVPYNATPYAPAVINSETGSIMRNETGTLEVTHGTNSDDKPITTFTWHNIPKYALEYDAQGNATSGHEAVYSITERTINGYSAAVYDNTGTDATGKTGDTAAAYNKGEITNKPTPPQGTDKTTYGAKGQSQTSPKVSDMFSVTTAKTTGGTDNTIETIKLVDPSTGKPTDNKTVNAVDENGNSVGTYTLKDDDGAITFTPDAGFVGDPKPLQISATDSNGLSTTAEYQPHVVDNEKKVTRTIVYTYLDGVTAKETVTQEVKFTGTVNKDTGDVTYDDSATGKWDEVTIPTIDGYNHDQSSDTVEEKTVHHYDSPVTINVIYSPKGIQPTADSTYGLPGKTQSGTPKFEMETTTYVDGTPNTLTIKLIDPNTGNPTDSNSVDALDDNGNKIGTYTLSNDGTVTFTPENGYVGEPKPLEIQAADRFGTLSRTTYQPRIVDPTSTGTATRTVSYTYETEDGTEVSGSVTQTVTLTRHAKSVDPKTGDVLEWDDWIPAKFPALANPDNKVDINVWTADSSAGEEEVSKPGEAPAVHVVYKKEPYTVTYLDGEHGTSNHAGDQTGEEYGSNVAGGNGVTPDKGYHFTGKYSYVIKDKFGNVVEEGETDDPTSIEITGNIEFTPLYEENKYTIKYDANGGSGTMDSQNFTGADSSATSKANEFTREGYDFTGFKAKLPDGSFLQDEDGNELIFKSAEDFIEYLHELGDGAEITLIAQWEPVTSPAPQQTYWVTYVDPDGTTVYLEKTTQVVGDPEPNAPANPAKDGYTFAGWERSVDADGNITYTAKWTPIEPAPAPDPDPEPEPEPEPTPEPEPAPTPTPAPSKAPIAVTNTATPTAPASTSKTSDDAPLLPLMVLAMFAAAGMVLSQLRRSTMAAESVVHSRHRAYIQNTNRKTAVGHGKHVK